MSLAWLVEMGISAHRNKMRTEITTLRKLARKGLTISQMVNATGLTKNTVYHRLDRHGIKMNYAKRGGPCLIGKYRDKMLELAKDPYQSISSISRQLGVSPASVRNWLKAEGVKAKGKNKHALHRCKNPFKTRAFTVLATLWNEPWRSDSSVARETRVSSETVGQVRLFMKRHVIAKNT